MAYNLINGELVTVTEQEHAETETLWKAQSEEMAKVQYQEDRKLAYPNLAEQLDYIYHNGIDKWKTDIVDPVKKKYPKPE